MHILTHQKALYVLAFHNMRRLMYSPERTFNTFASVKSNCIKWHCMLPSKHASNAFLHLQLFPSSWKALPFCVAAGLNQWEEWWDRGQKYVLGCLFSVYLGSACCAWYNSAHLSGVQLFWSIYLLLSAGLDVVTVDGASVSSVCSLSLCVSVWFAVMFILVYVFGGLR